MDSKETFLQAVIDGDFAAVSGALHSEPQRAQSRGVVQGLGGNPAAMTIAARFGHAQIVELLLDGGASIDDAADPERIETAVNIAANHGHAAVVDLLMKRGANLNIHYTPAHWAWYA